MEQIFNRFLVVLLLCLSTPTLFPRPPDPNSRNPGLPGVLLLAGAQTCPARPSSVAAAGVPEPTNHGALQPIISGAARTRGAVLGRELPYAAIREEISRHYNSSTLPIGPFIIEWIKYTQNALYLAGFMVFVGVVLPVVMMLLWISWECCYEVDEEEEEEYRNETRCAQVVAWTLASTITLLIICLIAFVGVLLAGNSLVNRSVAEGGGAVGVVLPAAAEVRDGAVEEVVGLVRGQYEVLLSNMYRRLGNVSTEVQSAVEQNLGTRAETFYEDVTLSLSRQPLLLSHAQLLLSHTLNLSAAVTGSSDSSSPISQHLTEFNRTLSDLRTLCTQFLAEEGGGGGASVNKSGLVVECEDLVGPGGGRYDPALSPNVSRLGGVRDSGGGGRLLLQELVEVLGGDGVFGDDGDVMNVWPMYFEEMSQNLTQPANSTLNVFYGLGSTFYQNLSGLLDQVLSFNTSLSLGLPSSQQQLQIFLGPRYLANWNEFRSHCTVAFALITLCLGLCLVIAMGRGLFNIYDIYIHGEETSSIEGAHQAGTMIRKLSFLLSVVCIISALIHGVSLVVVGGLGQSCQPKGNLSQLLRSVVDHNSTWRGTYLLGKGVLGNASYPLTFEEVLGRCRLNQSVYQSFQLGNVFDLEAAFFVAASEMEDFRGSLVNLSDLVTPFSALLPRPHQQLALLTEALALPVRWQDFTSLSLTSGLFNGNFVGLDQLNGKLRNMQAALTNTTTAHNFTMALDQASLSLSSLTTYLNSSLLPSLSVSAGYLQGQTQESQLSSGLREREEQLQSEVRLEVVREAHRFLTFAALAVNQNHSDYRSRTSHSLQCETGSCHSLYLLHTQLTSAVCDQLVPGLDVYWTSLMAVLCVGLCVMALSLLLASRLVDFKLDKPNKLHIVSSSIRQARAISWYLVGVGVNTWLVVAVALDEYLAEVVCADGGCCAECVWIFGVIFLLLSVVLGAASHFYQCVMLHRLTKGIKIPKVRKYWMSKKKATQFHCQLAILIIQDIPFLILAGIYTSRISMLTVPSFFSLTVSLLGIASYLVYIFRERNNIFNYCLCLKNAFKRSSKFDVQGSGGDYPLGGDGAGGRVGNGQAMMGMNGRPNGRFYGSGSEHSGSDSQSTTQPVEDWMYNSHNPGGHDHRLSVIPEHFEGMDVPPPPTHQGVLGDIGGSSSSAPSPSGGGRGRGGRNMTVPVYMHPQDSDPEPAPLDSMHLDRVSSPTESAIRHRRDAASRGTEGIEVASSIHPLDSSSASYLGSVTGSDMHGYYSSSQPADDMSDYRDDYDSDYSHMYAQRSKLRLQLAGLPYSYEMSVDV